VLKLFAFIKKDFQIAMSYRFHIILRFGFMIATLFMFYFIGQTFSGSISPYLEAYGGSYFPYVLVGMAVSSFVSVGLSSLSADVRDAQVKGTLEALLSTPTSIFTILIGNSMWSFITSFLSSVIMLVGGMIFLNISIVVTQLIITFIVLLLTFIAFLTVGMLSAAFIMIFKQGSPIDVIFGSSSYFLGGIFFPLEVLPKPLQAVGYMLPITHSIRALRDLLLAHVNPVEIISPLINLIIFIIIVGPVSLIFFRYAVKRAKKNGSLIQY
jgi:ABC-2 type transport system permease protein